MIYSPEYSIYVSLSRGFHKKPSLVRDGKQLMRDGAYRNAMSIVAVLIAMIYILLS